MSLNSEELEAIPELMRKKKFSCFIKGKSLYFAYKFGNFYFFNNKKLEKKIEGFSEYLLTCRAFLNFLEIDSINLNHMLIKFVVSGKSIQVCSLESRVDIQITKKKFKKIFSDFQYLRYGNFFFFKNTFEIEQEKINEMNELISDNRESNSFNYLKRFFISNLKSKEESLELKSITFYSSDRDIIFWI